ncbi:MAG: TrkH family potassium uptake protein [Clostridiales bacterium]|nr:TrkH family potassium uptake protein [Clostridiales bacterium]
MKIRLTFRLVGYVLLVEAALMLLSLIVALIYHGSEWLAFLQTMLITGLVGGLLTRLKPRNDNLRAREGFAVVALSWIALSFFGALPFFLHRSIPNLIDAFFETASGFTTTGASILTDVEALPNGLLFWRSFTHFVGGMGVLVLSLALIPKMGSRSIYLMRAESPGPSTDKLVPRLGQSAKILYLLYVALTVVMYFCLRLTGVGVFDSLIHCFGTAGTGGFSNYGASVAAFNNPAAENVITFFMFAFGVNFSIYYYVITRNWKGIKANSELKVYFLAMFISSIVIALKLVQEMGYSLPDSLRLSFFQVNTVMSTTGYATCDFDKWPQLCRTIMVALMLCGASAGSTGGGIKWIRVQLLCKSMVREIRKTVHPKSVNIVKLDGRVVDENTLTGVFGFFFAYFAILVIATLVISFDGFSFETNVTAVISALSNIGPGLGVVGPTGNFAGYSDFSTFVLALCMLIGRLEIFPMLMLLAPSAWARY